MKTCSQDATSQNAAGLLAVSLLLFFFLSLGFPQSNQPTTGFAHPAENGIDTRSDTIALLPQQLNASTRHVDKHLHDASDLIPPTVASARTVSMAEVAHAFLLPDPASGSVHSWSARAPPVITES